MRLLLCSLIACLAASFASAEYIEGGTDTKQLWICDTPEQLLKILETARDDGFSASKLELQLINAELNEHNEFPCAGTNVTTFTYIRQMTTVEDVEMYDGERRTLHIVLVSYRDVSGNTRTAASAHTRPLPTPPVIEPSAL